MDYKGYQSYKEQSVSTMTKGEMLLLLYDEMVKRLSRASFALEHQNFQLFEQSVDRAVDIVRYLLGTLNYDYQVSRELRQMYDFFLYELSRLKAGRNASIIPGLQGLVREMREAFSEAARATGL